MVVWMKVGEEKQMPNKPRQKPSWELKVVMESIQIRAFDKFVRTQESSLPSQIHELI